MFDDTSFHSRVVQSNEGQALIVRYDQLIERLKEFEQSIFDSWSVMVEQTIEENLDKPLIVRKRNSAELALNFSPQLFAILREVHYLRLMEKENIPERGLEFSEKSDVYRSYTLNLEKTVEWYNKIRRNCTEVELELIKGEIETIDGLLERAVNELTWNSEGNCFHPKNRFLNPRVLHRYFRVYAENTQPCGAAAGTHAQHSEQFKGNSNTDVILGQSTTV